MSRAVFDSLVDALAEGCKEKSSASLPLEQVYEAVVLRRAEREKCLANFAPKDAAIGLAYDLLAVFDVVAATARLESAGRAAADSDIPVAAEVIDLWIRATAARALWYDRFVQWPLEEGAQKLDHLCDTAKKLGAESIALALARNCQPLKFTSFVGSVANEPPAK